MLVEPVVIVSDSQELVLSKKKKKSVLLRKGKQVLSPPINLRDKIKVVPVGSIVL